MWQLDMALFSRLFPQFHLNGIIDVLISASYGSNCSGSLRRSGSEGSSGVKNTPDSWNGGKSHLKSNGKRNSQTRLHLRNLANFVQSAETFESLARRREWPPCALWHRAPPKGLCTGDEWKSDKCHRNAKCFGFKLFVVSSMQNLMQKQWEKSKVHVGKPEGWRSPALQSVVATFVTNPI